MNVYRFLLWFLFLVGLAVCVTIFVGMRKLFKKANRPGRYSLIPIYNIYTISDIAWQTKNFRYLLLWIALAVMSAFLNLLFIYYISYLLIVSQYFIIWYFLAQNFWRKKSASVLSWLTPWINYAVLWLSTDQYIFADGKDHPILQIPKQKQIDANVLNDIENEIHNNYSGGNVTRDWNNPDVSTWNNYRTDISNNQGASSGNNQVVNSMNNINNWSNTVVYN